MFWKISFKTMLIALFTFLSCKATNEVSKEGGLSELTHFGVCYAKVTPEQVAGYELVIIEPDFYTKLEIEALKSNGTKILAYITLGEIDANRWYYPKLQERGFLGTNKNWNSSYLNLEDAVTRSVILNEVLPEVTAKGVDGIFMDTIDAVSPYTERFHLKPYMLELIKEIKTRNPDLLILQNSGLFLLEDSKEFIDGVLIEDIASGYNFEKQEYFIKDSEAYHERLRLIREYSEENKFPFFIVDFAIDTAAIKQVKTRLDSLSTPYFISNIQLNQLPTILPETENKSF